MGWQLHFLGTGDSRAAAELGSSAAVIERDGKPLLLIDCGPDIVDRYLAAYQAPPAAIYITHTHMDHVGGLERLFVQLQFDPQRRGHTRLFVHAAVLPLLHGRVADYPSALAEGGVNFWEAFRLVPCTRGFWLDGLWFDLFATRHHVPGTSFGLCLPGSLVFTGDTRPIPEMLEVVAGRGESVVHDCSLHGNPSHSGLDDLQREYPPEVQQRLWLYHYGSVTDGQVMADKGFRVAQPGNRINLPPPWPVREDAG